MSIRDQVFDDIKKCCESAGEPSESFKMPPFLKECFVPKGMYVVILGKPYKLPCSCFVFSNVSTMSQQAVDEYMISNKEIGSFIVRPELSIVPCVCLEEYLQSIDN